MIFTDYQISLGDITEHLEYSEYINHTKLHDFLVIYFTAKPGKPTGPLAVSDITKSQCRLKWKPPKDDGGSRLHHYQVERREVGKPYWTTVHSHCKVRIVCYRTW